MPMGTWQTQVPHHICPPFKGGVARHSCPCSLGRFSASQGGTMRWRLQLLSSHRRLTVSNPFLLPNVNIFVELENKLFAST